MLTANIKAIPEDEEQYPEDSEIDLFQENWEYFR